MPLADTTGIPDGFLNYGFAGLVLAILFWFLRALVVHGVKPFVDSTMRNQAAMTTSLEAVRQSSERTAALVADLHRDIKDTRK